MFNLIKFSKTRKGDLVMEINPPKISLKSVFKFIVIFLMFVFNPIFNFFDYLAENRKLVVSAVGLGIGLGLSIITTQRPDILQAFPEVVSSKQGVEVKELSISKFNFYSAVEMWKKDEATSGLFATHLFQLSNFGNLSSSKAVVVTDSSFHHSLAFLDKVHIGDKIVAKGSNNGNYSFEVSEVKEIEAEFLTEIVFRHENSLIIYTPTNLLRTRILVVVAH